MATAAADDAGGPAMLAAHWHLHFDNHISHSYWHFRYSNATFRLTGIVNLCVNAMQRDAPVRKHRHAPDQNSRMR
jgi:hypothetical protein